MINDVGLGIWMVIATVQRCHNGFVLLTKQADGLRYLYFVEGVVFVALSLLIVRHGGVFSMILCSVGCSVFFSLTYGVWRTHKYFQISATEVGLGWILPMGQIIILCAMIATGLGLITQRIDGDTTKLVMNCGLYAAMAGAFFIRYGLDPNLQKEIATRAPYALLIILKPLLTTSK